MSDARKAQLKAQLKLAREKKKALKEAGKEIPKEPKVKVVLEATATEPAIHVKNVRKTKDHTKDIEELKSQIAELKAHNSKQDKEELAQLRLEMKNIKEEKKQQTKKVAEYKKPNFCNYFFLGLNFFSYKSSLSLPVLVSSLIVGNSFNTIFLTSWVILKSICLSSLVKVLFKI